MFLDRFSATGIGSLSANYNVFRCINRLGKMHPLFKATSFSSCLLQIICLSAERGKKKGTTPEEITVGIPQENYQSWEKVVPI